MECQSQSKENPEFAALKEFVTQLKSKHLTAEAFFRICDTTYSQSFSQDIFIEALKNLKLSLTKNQIRRLVFILDEDMEQQIKLQEYQDALAAYKLDGEKHISCADNNPFVSFEIRTVQHLKSILAERKITADELINSMEGQRDEISEESQDDSMSHTIDLEEFKELVATLKPSIQLKQLQSLYNYFDLDKNGFISKTEFLMQINGAPPQKQVRIKNKSINPIETELPGFSKMTPREQSELALQYVKTQMNQFKIKVSTVFNMADKNQTGSVQVTSIYQSLVKLAPQLNRLIIEEALNIFGRPQSIITKEDFFVTLGETNTKSLVAPRALDQKLNINSTTVDKTPQIINKLADALSKQGISPLVAFKNADQNADGKITINELLQTIKRLIPSSEFTGSNLKMLMMTLDLNKNGLIEKEEFLKAFQKTKLDVSPPKLITFELDYEDYSIVEVVKEIEKIHKVQIQRVLLPFIEQDILPVANLVNILQKPPNPVPHKLILKFSDLCGAENQKLQISSIVRQLVKCPNIANNQKVISTLAKSVIKPIRETLQQQIINWKDGITKDEFVSVFQNIGEIDKWQLICLYHSISTLSQLKNNNNESEIVSFDSLVQLLVRSQDSLANEKQTLSLPKTHLHDEGKPAQAYHNKDHHVNKVQYSINLKLETKLQIDQLLVRSFKDDQIKNLHFNSDLKSFDVNSTLVCQTLKTFYCLSNLIVHDINFVQNTLIKLSNELHRIEQENQQTTQAFFFSVFKEIQEDNPNIEQFNIFMAQVVFQKMDIFNEFEQVVLTILLADSANLNLLWLDANFIKHLFIIPKTGQKKDWNQFESLCNKRLILNLELSTQVVQAMLISNLKQSEKSERIIEITDDLVWTKVRFNSIASTMVSELKSSVKLNKFLQAFKEAAGNQLTYQNFRQLITQVLGIQSIHEWTYQQLEQYLDQTDKAHIQLQEVAYFLSLYDFKLLEEHSEEEQRNFIKQKTRSLNDEQVANYKLNDNDYYKKDVGSIFNSEFAAIVYAEKIYRETPKDQKWSDPDFGPTKDDPQGLKSLFFDGQIPNRYPYNDDENIEWQRPNEVVSLKNQNKNCYFLQNNASSNEAIQGKLANCWVISAISVIATRDELIRGGGDWIANQIQMVDSKLAQNCCSGVYPPLFHKFRNKRIYIFKFYKDFDWRYVVIDDKLPYKFDELLYAKCKQDTELWVPLIEKAYAKLFGCYQALETGNIDDAIADMTGYPCEKLILHDKQNEFIRDKEDFWNYLKTEFKNGSLMGCSRSGLGRESLLYLDQQNTGILLGHAYSISKVFEIQDQNMENQRKSHRLLIIRNPNGDTEWKLKWGPESQQIEDMKTQLHQILQEMDEEDQIDFQAQEGTFIMNYESFRQVFDKLFVAQDFPDDWCAIQYQSQWTDKTSCGLPIENTEHARIRYGGNPQYFFSCSKDSDLFISLGQNDARVMKAEKKQPSIYPFRDEILCVQLAIFELEQSQEKLTKYTKPLASSGNPKSASDISIKLKVQAGKRYIIVPSVRIAGLVGQFNLRFYFNAQLNEVETRRVDDPTEEYGFVMTQHMNSQRMLAPWKAQWVKDIVNNDFIIRHQDNRTI